MNQKPRLKSWTIITLGGWNPRWLELFPLNIVQTKGLKIFISSVISHSLLHCCYQCNNTTNPLRLANASFYSHYNNSFNLKYSSTESVYRDNKVNDILYLIPLFSCAECRLDPLALLLYLNVYGPEGEKNLTPLFPCSLQNFQQLQYDHVHIPQSHVQ